MAAYIDWVRQFCLSLPHTTEKVRWEHNLLFCIGDKMFCVANLEPGMGPSKISFKCSPEKFAELLEIEGIIPTPYSARHHWVSLTEADTLRQSETQALIREAYEIVRGNLPRKLQSAWMAGNVKPQKAQAVKRATKKPKNTKPKATKKKTVKSRSLQKRSSQKRSSQKKPLQKKKSARG
jgi:predicted DNA-binding protein (MmcQ/YjbR family)